MCDRSADWPQLVTREDFPEILELVTRCFDKQTGGMRAQWGHCYDETEPERHAVIRRDGRIVSEASVVENVFVIDGHCLPYWGLTDVATDPRYRGGNHVRPRRVLARTDGRPGGRPPAVRSHRNGRVQSPFLESVTPLAFSLPIPNRV